MNYNETLDYIHSLNTFPKNPSLERINKVLNLLGNPQDKIKTIHIAGTNGKGSVSVMLNDIFIDAGYKTGLFISPFVIDFNERIQINSRYISHEDLIKYTETIKNLNCDLTEFEFITAIMFLYFFDNQCDIAIIETGLGGRFDATNAIKNPIASVITKIGLDHTSVLGNTVEKIAFEKCGIIKDSITISDYNQPEKALEVIKENADPLCIPDVNALNIISSDINGNTLIYKEKEYKTKLIGKYQIENALTAIETAMNCGEKLSYQNIFNGVYNAFITARAEILSRNPLIILDGAHNPDGARALSEIIKPYSGNVTAIIAMVKDKDQDTVLKEILPMCKNVVTVTVKLSNRGLTGENLAVIAKKYCCEVTAASDIEAAINKAKEISNGNPIFIFGSLFLASEVKSVIN